MMHPTIHMNGTSRTTLETEILDAMEAVRIAAKRVNAMTVNGRDYYPQGPDAINEAIRERESRFLRLRQVHNELTEMYTAMADSDKAGL